MQHMHSMEGMPLLPWWLRVVWAVALAGVLALHLRHSWRLRGQHRWWHAGHAVMAGGMIVMYLVPMMTHPGLYRAGSALFVVIAMGIAVTVSVLRNREGALNPLWVAAGVDMMAMAYMAVPSAQHKVLTAALVGYLGCQALAWTLGLWARVPVFRVATAGDAPGAAAGLGEGKLGLSARCTPVTRASLAVMAVGMAYMLAVM